jgi:hypothetical protein
MISMGRQATSASIVDGTTLSFNSCSDKESSYMYAIWYVDSHRSLRSQVSACSFVVKHASLIYAVHAMLARCSCLSAPFRSPFPCVPDYAIICKTIHVGRFASLETRKEKQSEIAKASGIFQTKREIFFRAP